jgi:integrase
MAVETQKTVKYALNHFERLVKPEKLSGITPQTIAAYVSKRTAEERPRKAKNGTHAMRRKRVAVPTVNRELRTLKAALNVAREWKLIAEVPKIRMLKRSEKLPTFVSPEHFALIYEACDSAKRPKDIPNVDSAAWWRALIVFAYMTGWRIGQILALKWADVDLEKKTAISRAEDNKGKRDVLLPLHDVIVEHLRPLAGSFSPRVFPWGHGRRMLWIDFDSLQESAGIPKCGRLDRWYGFHDLRRGFATLNAADVNLFELQALMQHKSLSTTKLYVNMANQLNATVNKLYVPDVARRAAVGSP